MKTSDFDLLVASQLAGDSAMFHLLGGKSEREQRPTTRSVTAAEYAKEIGTTVSAARRRLEKMGVESVLITGMTERTSPLSDRCFGPMPFRSREYRLPLRQKP